MIFLGIFLVICGLSGLALIFHLICVDRDLWKSDSEGWEKIYRREKQLRLQLLASAGLTRADEERG